MNLNDLPVGELARIDSICLDYEIRLRDGSAEPIEQIVRRYGGRHPELLRGELEAVLAELSGAGADPRLLGDVSPIPPTSDPGLTQQLLSPAAAGTVAATEAAGIASAPGTPRPASAVQSWDRSGVSPGDGPADDSNTDPPRPGQQIGPYRIDGVLGRGGMGVVYRATDSRLGRSVAIKFLDARGMYREELTERFQREAKAVAKISHPNVIELFDVGLHRGLPYAVMEHLQGETLLERFKRGPMSAAQVRNLGAQIAQALDKSHRTGVIHRDLKPHNVMLLDPAAADETTDPSPPRPEFPIIKLFDFGLSRLPRGLMTGDRNDIDAGLIGDAAAADAADLRADLDDATRVGMILGTPGYMAPEQARGEPVSPAADIFSLGCVLFEAFYGVRAFDGRTPADRFAATLDQTPLPDPIRRRDDVELADLITRCLAKRPEDRPASAASIATLLRATALPQKVGLNRSAGDATPPTADGRDGGAWLPDRRTALEAAAGAAIGFFAGGWFHTSAQLRGIRSLGVLTLIAEDSGATPGELGRPIGDRPPHAGELLSGLLVNQLSRIDSLRVPKFFPVHASTPSEFIDVAQKLGVDALVDGSYRSVGGGVIEVNLQIISGADGSQLWGDRWQVESGSGNLIQQRFLANELAQRIGRQLSGDADDPAAAPNPAAFFCLTKGHMLADPDSREGLQSALMCYERANSEDVTYPPTHAGVALTAITLAGISDEETCKSLIGKARRFVESGLKLDPTNREAILADAMIRWQVDYQYAQAEAMLVPLAARSPNHWQVHHQLGLLRMTMGQDVDAMRSLEYASRLHPMSQSLKADVARADWFMGNLETARRTAEVAIEEAAGTTSIGSAMPDDSIRGLLIDMAEQQSSFAAAASLDPEASWQQPQRRDLYFAQRRRRLAELPYGGFGTVGNAVILTQRSGDDTPAESTELRLARWKESQSPSLPLLLSRHPALTGMKTSQEASRILP